MSTSSSADCAPLSFRAERWFVAAQIKSVVVRLPRPLENVSLLSHQEVLIDGLLYRCSGVRTASHPPPFRTGEFVALLVETPED